MQHRLSGAAAAVHESIYFIFHRTRESQDREHLHGYGTKAGREIHAKKRRIGVETRITECEDPLSAAFC